MSRQAIADVQRTLTAMYKAHELSAEQYASLMEDTRKVRRS